MRIHRRHPSIIAALIATVLLFTAVGGCASGGGAPVSGLEGSPWRAVEVASPAAASGSMLKVPEGADVTMLLKDGKVTGRGGVNQYFGEYTATADSIEFGQLGSTEMAGPPELMELEAAFLAALGRTAAYRLEGESLELLDEAGSVTVRMVPGAEVAIEGVDWVATGINNGKGAVQSPSIGSTVTARFEGGSVSGNATINGYNGPYTLDGESLTVGPLIATKMGGPEPLMAQETAFLAAMDSVRGYRFDGDRLNLVSADGATQVTFVPASTLEPALPPDTPTSSPAP